MASTVWHLVLKERIGTAVTTEGQSASTPKASTPNSTQATPGAQTPDAAAVPSTPVSAVTAPGSNDSAAANFDAGRKFMASGDYNQARKHLEAAVNAGDGAAACLLGEMTLKGQGGITASHEASAKLFQLAQSRGSICFAPGQ
jgi:TPR repeat protein